MLLFLVILLLVAGSGGWGYSRYGYVGLSPAGIIVLILLLFWFTGNLHVPNHPPRI